MQYDKVDPETCRSVSFCPQATPPISGKFIVMLIALIWLKEIEEEKGNLGEYGEHESLV